MPVAIPFPGTSPDCASGAEQLADQSAATDSNEERFPLDDQLPLEDHFLPADLRELSGQLRNDAIWLADRFPALAPGTNVRSAVASTGPVAEPNAVPGSNVPVISAPHDGHADSSKPLLRNAILTAMVCFFRRTAAIWLIVIGLSGGLGIHRMLMNLPVHDDYTAGNDFLGNDLAGRVLHDRVQPDGVLPGTLASSPLAGLPQGGAESSVVPTSLTLPVSGAVPLRSVLFEECSGPEREALLDLLETSPEEEDRIAM